MNQQEQRPRRSNSRRQRRMPLMGYLVILFAVAFFLLFMAYCQQQRQNTEATNDALKQSVSAVDTIQVMMADNQELREQVGALEDQVERLQKDYDALKEQSQADAAARAQQEAAIAAMDYFWQIDEAYVRQRYSLCRQLIQDLKDSGYESALPDTKAVDNDRYSPAGRYQEIYNALY